MGTIKRPRGRMTQPLRTPYRVGDRVTLTDTSSLEDLLEWWGLLKVGDTGRIVKIRIACRSDGDDTFLMFDVIIGGVQVALHASEFARPEDAPAAIWAARQFNALHKEADGEANGETR